MVLSLRDEAVIDKFDEEFCAFMKSWSQQFVETMTQVLQKNDPEVVLDYEEGENHQTELGIPVVADVGVKEGESIGHEDGDSSGNQLKTQSVDDSFVSEAGELKLMKRKDPRPNMQVYVQLMWYEVNSISKSEFMYPSLLSNKTAVGMFSAYENRILTVVEVFDENPKPNGYIVALNPEPPDNYSQIIVGGTLIKLKLDPWTVKPIDRIENYERMSVAMDVNKVFDKSLEREWGNNRQAISEGVEETQVILKFNRYFVEGNPRKKMVQIFHGTSNTSPENLLVNAFNNTYVKCLADSKFDMLQYGCSIKGKCDEIIIIASIETKEEQVIELIQLAKCDSIKPSHKFSQPGNKGITSTNYKYCEDASRMSLRKFFLIFPRGQPNIGQGNWTNFSLENFSNICVVDGDLHLRVQHWRESDEIEFDGRELLQLVACFISKYL